jgi:hypothetical protein
MRAREVESARVFIVRLTAGVDAGAIRGHVRDGATGAYRAFTAWDELTSFLAEQLDEVVRTRTGSPPLSRPPLSQPPLSQPPLSKEKP